MFNKVVVYAKKSESKDFISLLLSFDLSFGRLISLKKKKIKIVYFLICIFVFKVNAYNFLAFQIYNFKIYCNIQNKVEQETMLVSYLKNNLK